MSVDFCGFAFLGHQVGSRDQVDGVTKRALFSDLGQELLGLLCQFNVFLLASDLEDLTDLFIVVRLRRNDQ